MVKVFEITLSQINASLVDIQNQINQMLYKLDSLEKEIDQLKKDSK